MSEHDPRDLVVIALSGVQRYITESRTTADAANASDIMARLATEAAIQLTGDGAELVIPARADPSAAPNRIVALTAAGNGADLARAAADRVRSECRAWTAHLFGASRDVPGFPEVMWTVAPAGTGGYADQWKTAQTALTARKRLRAFDYPERTGTRPCAVSPRWPSEKSPPPGVPRHERGSELSAGVWLKRRWHATPALPSTHSRGFPSTASIASTPFRARVLDAWTAPGVRGLVAELSAAARDVMGENRFRSLEGAVPALDRAGQDGLRQWFVRGAGWWVTPETWNADTLTHEYGIPGSPVDTGAVRRGRRATEELAEAVGADANPYYAVLAADLDGLGAHLSAAPVTRERHRRVSDRLGDLSRAHGRRVQVDHSGVTVYSGGDDLLAFLPAETALEAAQACRDEVDENPTTLSCAVLFAHQGSPLHTAIARSRELLVEAKGVPNKNAVAVGYITGSGARSHTVRSWSSDRVADALGTLRAFEPRTGGAAPTSEDRGLSPRLVNDLYAERAALTDLAASPHRKTYEAEVARLVLRHGGSARQARDLVNLGRSEYGESSHAPVPLAAARVAVFLRRQAW
ncbi:type III-B CRISPR-associated protein Cas10/Cmr2 [Nocardiopsis sp. CNR-923]|uniref:type III-B CRISPR-associated protein Cas10/Cmr2 n=1 Tax=Nocardiopsis sp. CNR-923 TaxID=1904965 RepID=UPI0009616725|nr:type III-B CRISPR-associated protein Cas10/Cmr2 [Nocardiopsis sp. CNR-923]OLT29292.1 type III-B CRISPR-associated protein Cas10/Cmr2 [Nocardiopsis sp. CNR-923]